MIENYLCCYRKQKMLVVGVKMRQLYEFGIGKNKRGTEEIDNLYRTLYLVIWDLIGG